MKKHTIIVLFFLFHFAVILAMSVKTLIGGYVNFYKIDPDKGFIGHIYHTLDAFTDLYIVRKYSLLSGTNTGYGFFSPNISSEIITVYSVKTFDGGEYRLMAPDFSCHESYLKYASSLSFYLQIVAIDSTYASFPDIKNYNHFMTAYLAGKLLYANSKIKEVNLQVYIYNYPSLDEYNRGITSPRYILLDSAHAEVNSK